MESKPGTYALILQSQAKGSVQVGRWGRLEIEPGYYVYIGSAFGPGGVSARVSRHCRETKPKHWHIDYLRDFAIPISAWYSYAPIHLEHAWAHAYAEMVDTTPVVGFGCSDCQCSSHLFHTETEPRLARFRRAVRGSVSSQIFHTSILRSPHPLSTTERDSIHVRPEQNWQKHHDPFIHAFSTGKPATSHAASPPTRSETSLRPMAVSRLAAMDDL
jgi:Uri superfamily endonuclease